MVAEDLARTGVEDVRVKTVGDTDSATESENITAFEGEIDALISSVEYALYLDDAPGMGIAKRVNETAVETETPLTVAQLLGLEAILGPTIVPGESPCLLCLLKRWQSFQDNLDSYRAYVESTTERQNIHLPAHERLLAGLVSKEATTQLLTGHGYVVGRTLDVDLLSMDLETNEVLKMPRCDVCGVKHEDWQRLIDFQAIKDD
ncbi:TOMM precursor leader peptide-binding protein [Natrinema salsiterrestre]|uniref:TOMM leader peptide-binding protein n=1 Tax=Natrinema salsiterrestre TaxID=2950540 RepID=A0A9Q4L039_9EURY|nr:TOMM precursor leader peptide-binding protein [Natrinema salsiterrestre]MDF9747475.1 TOMM precursor leader peptide-binding protein [Natrinema salsiterrestre]